MAWGEVHQVVTSGIWSALLPVGVDGALLRGRPGRAGAAGVVAVPALGAGCLGSAVVFQRDAASPDEAQPPRVIPYQIGALGD